MRTSGTRYSRSIRTTPLVIGLILVAGIGAFAQTVIRSADQKFAMEAASGGMAEVKLGQLAQEKGMSDQVKMFGQMMMTDHTKANQQLKLVAQEQGIKLPMALSKQDQMTYDRLSKLNGAQFDRAYAQDMLQDHQKDVAAFEKEANSGQNNELKKFASQTLPTLKTHLQHAQDLTKQSTSSSSY